MTDLNHYYGLLENYETIFKMFGVVTEIQVDFLTEHQLSPSFGDLILVELAKGFNLHHQAARTPNIPNHPFGTSKSSKPSSKPVRITGQTWIHSINQASAERNDPVSEQNPSGYVVILQRSGINLPKIYFFKMKFFKLKFCYSIKGTTNTINLEMKNCNSIHQDGAQFS